MKYDVHGLLPRQDLPIPLSFAAKSKSGQLYLYVSLRLFG